MHNKIMFSSRKENMDLFLFTYNYFIFTLKLHYTLFWIQFEH